MGSFGIRDVQGVLWHNRGEKEGTPAWDNIYQMQHLGDAGTFQGYQHHKNLPHGPQGQEWSPEEYIGESSRTFGDRIKEHLRAPSPIHDHSQSTGHLVSPEHVTIFDRET